MDKKVVRSWNKLPIIVKLWYRIVYIFAKNKMPKRYRKYIEHQHKKAINGIKRFFGKSKDIATPAAKRFVNDIANSDIDITKDGFATTAMKVGSTALSSYRKEVQYNNAIQNAAAILKNDNTRTIEDASNQIQDDFHDFDETRDRIENITNPSSGKKKKKKKKKPLTINIDTFGDDSKFIKWTNTELDVNAPKLLSAVGKITSSACNCIQCRSASPNKSSNTSMIKEVQFDLDMDEENNYIIHSRKKNKTVLV